MVPNPSGEDAEASPGAPKSNRRYLAGMLIYGVLAVLAGVTLDGTIRIATWIFLGGLALKTWLGVLRDRSD